MYCIALPALNENTPRMSFLHIVAARRSTRMGSMMYRLFLPLLIMASLAGCERPDALESIKDSGELVVVSRNSPTTYFINKNEPAGFEYALAGRLAEELGVELVIKPAFTLGGIFERLDRREADLAAAGLTLTDERAALYPHSRSYETLTTQVVYLAGERRPRKVADLAGRQIVVLADSSHAEALRRLRESRLPELAWEEIEAADTMELLELVDEREADLALIDSNEFAVQQSLYPRIKLGFDLVDEQQAVWYLAPHRDNDALVAVIDDLMARMEESGELGQLREQLFGHVDSMSRIGSHTFMLNMRRSLPDYRQLIKLVAREYQMDWRLLAAIAYQESHWNPDAASPTGVRGMMMLTLPTAREMGVTNRLDPAQSLRGGARYFKNMRRRLPNDIDEPDRTWMALAAYNIGMGHLHDARALTEHYGGDPHLWRDVMEYLPMLQKSAYYKSLRYGYARGLEAVTYVQNIRHYYSILTWQDIPDNQQSPPLKADDYIPDSVREIGLLAL